MSIRTLLYIYRAMVSLYPLLGMFIFRVARWLSPKYRTLAVPVSLEQTIELFTHVLSGILINIIPDKDLKYRTVRLNTWQPYSSIMYQESGCIFCIGDLYFFRLLKLFFTELH